MFTLRKLALAQVSYRDDFFISYCVYVMMGHFISHLFEGTLHVDKIHVRFKIANIMHVLLVPVHRQTGFTPKWMVVLHLHDAIAKFHTRMKSCSGTTIGMNSRWAALCWHDICVGIM